MDYTLLLPLSVILLLAFLIPLLFHLSHKINQKEHHSATQGAPYESGIKATISDPSERFNVKYYLVGILFILFDVESLFMFPWAVNLRELSLFGLVEMFAFMGFLLIGLLYVYRSKALVWR